VTAGHAFFKNIFYSSSMSYNNYALTGLFFFLGSSTVARYIPIFSFIMKEKRKTIRTDNSTRVLLAIQTNPILKLYIGGRHHQVGFPLPGCRTCYYFIVGSFLLLAKQKKKYARLGFFFFARMNT